ncbi:MAG: formate dehydrogenase subunit gamma [Gammaproteobacteria bacterium]|jgi:formate dehydrogenase subunit gamma
MQATSPDAPLESVDGRRIRAIVSGLADLPGALLPILHAIQKEFGYVPPESVEIVADTLNLSRAEVHGVITFYHFFRTSPPGERILFICRAEACQSMGAPALEDYARRKLGVDFHGTTQDGRFTLEPVYCLGNCACSPAVMIDDEVFGRVTPERLDEILE